MSTSTAPALLDREQLVLDHVWLAEVLAGQARRPFGFTWQDARSAALEGLVRAARVFDPTLGAGQFKPFAVQRMRWAIVDGIRRDAPWGNPRNWGNGGAGLPKPWPVTIADVPRHQERSDEPEPEEVVILEEEAAVVRTAVDALPPRLHLVVRRYFYEDRTLAQIGAELGVTESRASQLMKLARKVLTETLS